MKCDKCGYDVYPGDQICMNCGAKLSLNNSVIPELHDLVTPKSDKSKKNIYIIIGTLVGILLLIFLVFIFVKFIVL